MGGRHENLNNYFDCMPLGVKYDLLVYFALFTWAH